MLRGLIGNLGEDKRLAGTKPRQLRRRDGPGVRQFRAGVPIQQERPGSGARIHAGPIVVRAPADPDRFDHRLGAVGPIVTDASERIGRLADPTPIASDEQACGRGPSGVEDAVRPVPNGNEPRPTFGFQRERRSLCIPGGQADLDKGARELFGRGMLGRTVEGWSDAHGDPDAVAAGEAENRDRDLDRKPMPSGPYCGKANWATQTPSPTIHAAPMRMIATGNQPGQNFRAKLTSPSITKS